MHDQALLARQLEYFEVLYRMRSYSKAAAAIPITHQGLRKAISKLESDLNVQLFEANEGGELEPTPYADALFEYTLKWTADIRHLRKDLDELKTHRTRTVTICAALGTLSTLGYNLIPDFNDARESLKIDFIDYSDDWVDSALLSEEFGIGLVRSPFDEGLSVTPLVTIKTAMWVPASNPLSNKPFLTLADLEGQNITIPEQHYKAHAFYREQLQKRGIHPKSVMSCSDLIWSHEYAAERRGLGMCLERRSGMPDDSSGLKCLTLMDGYVQTVGIAYRKGHTLTPDERIVFDYFVENAREA